MKQHALASDLDLTKVAIGGLLDRLESGGFVERRADATDGRARRVFLTRAGARLVTTIRAGVQRVEVEILARIPEKDLEQAAETLLTLKQTLLEKIESAGEDESESEEADSLEQAAE
jgi:DNA-binding MarR family transcriptional regulator